MLLHLNSRRIGTNCNVYLRKSRTNVKIQSTYTHSAIPSFYNRAFCTTVTPTQQSNLTSHKNENDFLNWAETRLGIKDKSDWYKVTPKQLDEIGGTAFLKQFNNSLPNMLSANFPQHEWLPWKFTHKPLNFWQNKDNQKKFMQWAATRLNIKDMSDWYTVTREKIANIGGNTLIHEYKNSPQLLISSVFPEYEWLPWKFVQCPRYFWDDVNNHKKYVEWVGKQLNIKEMDDWYKVGVKDFMDIGGGSLIKSKYQGSLVAMLSTLYPEHNWELWKFPRKPRSNDKESDKRFLEWAGNQLGVKEMSDWYKVTGKELANIGGHQLLNQHRGSFARLLATVYPDYDWLPWKFIKAPGHAREEIANKKKFLDWAGQQLGIKEFTDWNKVTLRDLVNLGGKTILNTQQYSLYEILEMTYPDQPLHLIRNKSGFFKKTQKLLYAMFQTMFPKEEILEDYRHPDIVSSAGQPLQLDFFYPQLKLAVEYQGQQHYRSNKMFQISLDEGKQRDKTKSVICKEKGITLIEVPFWWDRTYESLAATVYSHRPDLFSSPPSGVPIPLTLDQVVRKSSSNPSQQQVLMSATVWEEESMDPTGWYLTEKYDGMRLHWDGSQYLSRQGNKVKVPDSWNLGSTVALDGELWTQYGLYQEAVGLSRVGKDEEKWSKATYWVFDAPTLNMPFEERLQQLKEMKEKGVLPSFVKIVDAEVCKGKEHLKEYFNAIIAKGGEGVILREPQSLYKAGRSPSLRKYKQFFDTEVLVLENNYPNGFNCQQRNGKPLFVGINDNYAEAKNIKKGAVITVKHLGANAHGTLQYPKFLRERTDVTWNDLINTK